MSLSPTIINMVGQLTLACRAYLVPCRIMGGLATWAASIHLIPVAPLTQVGTPQNVPTYYL